jgi:hypothetical protein
MKYFIIATTGSTTETGKALKTCSETGYDTYEEAATVVEKKKKHQLDFCDNEEEKAEVERDFSENFEIVPVEKTIWNGEAGYSVDFKNHQMQHWISE